MKRCLSIWAGTLFLTITASGADLLLVLVDETLRVPLAPQLSEWTARITAEARYQVVIEGAPRAGVESNRLAALAAMRKRIEALQPAAVQLVGHLPWGISGWENPDGHEFRASLTDAHFMAKGFVGTDAFNWGSTGYRPNMAGDGRWDEFEIATWGRPVGRIDLGGLSGSMESNPAYQYPSGCLKGRPYCETVAEIPAMQDYFRRNIEYRIGRSRWTTNAAMAGPLWTLQQTQPEWSLARMPQYQWARSTQLAPAAGRKVFLLWHSAANSELVQLYDADCQNVQPVWSNTYRSYGMEMDACGTMRRWLLVSLVSTWGPRWWVVGPGARTVGDAITGTYAVQGRWSLLYHLMGDVSLPLRVAPGPEVPTNFRKTSL